jgi:hypothetical protein
MHDSCPDCAGTQPKRTIIPVYPESQSVTGWLGPVICYASLTPGEPGRLCPGGGGGAGPPEARRLAGGGRGHGPPEARRLAGGGRGHGPPEARRLAGGE